VEEGLYTQGLNFRRLGSCLAYRVSINFFYLLFSQECYCGNALASQSTVASDSDCNMACAGNVTEACGGSGRMSLFTSGQPAPPPPVTNPGPGLWTSQGCYT
jgi:hypothetical protein